MLSLLVVAVVLSGYGGSCDTITVDWNAVVRPLSTRPALQVRGFGELDKRAAGTGEGSRLTPSVLSPLF